MPRIVSEMVHLLLSKSEIFFSAESMFAFFLFKQCCTFEIFLSDPSKIVVFVGLFLAETTRWWWASYLHSEALAKDGHYHLG